MARLTRRLLHEVERTRVKNGGVLAERDGRLEGAGRILAGDLRRARAPRGRLGRVGLALPERLAHGARREHELPHRRTPSAPSAPRTETPSARRSRAHLTERREKTHPTHGRGQTRNGAIPRS